MEAPLGIYIHLPYCIHRCVYCDFNVYLLKSEDGFEWYLEALQKEISFHAQNLSSRTVDTIYFGGGTPSLFSHRHIEKVISQISSQFKAASSLEISLEANPCSTTYKKLKGFKDAGVNRVSFGIQTFNSEHLKTLERTHSSEQAKEAIGAAKNVGFSSINLDFIFGIPKQTLGELQKDISRALDFNPEHISVYNLTVPSLNPLTPFLLSEETQVEMVQWLSGYLPSQGYDHYETSAFSKKGFQCRHNLKYWRYEDYLGIGAGSYSYLRSPQNPWGISFKNVNSLKQYWGMVSKDGHAIGEKEILSKEIAKKNTLVAQMRLLQEGVSLSRFESRFGEVFSDVYKEELRRLIKGGFLDSSGRVLKLTLKGKLYLNQVLLEFM